MTPGLTVESLSPQLRECIKAHLSLHPQELVSRCEFGKQILWIKQRPVSKKTHWHRLQSALTRFIAIPIFYPTVSLGGAESLAQEAARLRLFAAKGIAVPRLVGVTADFIITEDAGTQLAEHLHNLPDGQQKEELLYKATLALCQLHQAGLCHGRPYLRDLTHQSGRILFLDLEEDPLAVMELAQAQARDFWLFSNSLLRHFPTDTSLFFKLYSAYTKEAPSNALAALEKMVFLLKPLLMIANAVVPSFIGKDLRNATHANKILEKALAPSR